MRTLKRKAPKRKLEREPAAPPANPPDTCCFASIKEPETLERARRLLHHVGYLEAEMNMVRNKLFGTCLPEVLIPEGQGLDAMIANAATRVASLLGDARTINIRLDK